jgi:hypothetical protein
MVEVQSTNFSLAQQWFGNGNQGMNFTKGSKIILSCSKFG